jgi:hypothetical protein
VPDFFGFAFLCGHIWVIFQSYLRKNTVNFLIPQKYFEFFSIKKLMANVSELDRAIIQRVMVVFDKLREKNVVKKTETFCAKTGLDAANFNKYRKLDGPGGPKQIYPSQLARLAREYGVNLAWLINGGPDENIFTGADAKPANATNANTLNNTNTNKLNFSGGGGAGAAGPDNIQALKEENAGLRREIELLKEIIVLLKK